MFEKPLTRRGDHTDFNGTDDFASPMDLSGEFIPYIGKTLPSRIGIRRQESELGQLRFRKSLPFAAIKLASTPWLPLTLTPTLGIGQSKASKRRAWNRAALRMPAPIE